MKKSLLIRFLVTVNLFFFLSSFSQNYTWVRGSNTATVAGVYGTQGVSAPGNTPGARHGGSTWTDASGNMWLFGGEGSINANPGQWFSDLWKYNPTTNQWTWVKGPNTTNQVGTYGTMGVAAPANNPGAREFSMSWTDAAGNFWLFGGDGIGTTYTTGAPMTKLADLWKYNPTTNQWTWMKGPNPNTINPPGVYGTLNTPSAGNYPGGRYWGGTWVDNNQKLWLFGGRGWGASAAGRLNDFWKYDPITNQWTWVSGSQAPDSPGIFGTLSVPASGNSPGARECPGFWTSTTGKLILFGGNGYASTGSIGLTNDTWEFNVTTGMWAWISGSNSINQAGTYGTAGVAATGNVPGARFSPACWTDAMGNYWMFGGEGIPAVGPSSAELNDLFKFNPTTSQWTWMKGSNLLNQLATYGTQGVAAPPNNPGGRTFNTWWANTSSGYLWLFGGLGYTSLNVYESMNDLWKFRIPCNPDSVVALQTPTICSGNSVNLSAFNQFPANVNWYTTPTPGTSVGSGSLFSTPTLTTQTTNTTYTYYAQANSCTYSPLAMVTITVMPLPQLSISGPSSVCPAQQIATVTISGAQTYLWSSGSTSTSITFTTSTPLNYTITGTGSNGCTSTGTYSVGVFVLPAITANTARSTICKNEAVVLTAGGGTAYVWNGSTNGPTISVTPTISTTYTVLGTDINGCSKSFTITQFVSACVGIETIGSVADRIIVYPNPGKGSFIVSLQSDAKLIITNQLGATVLEKKLSEGDNPVDTGLNKGVYFYRLSFSNNRTSTGKILVE